MNFFWFGLVFLLPSLASAELGPLFGVDPVSSGMGATSLLQGRPSPYQVFSAPATLGFLRSVEVGVGAVYFSPQLKPFGTLVLNSNGGLGEFKEAGVLAGGGQVLALAFPIGKTRPLTIGVLAYLPFSTLIRVSGNPVNFPFYPLYNDISRNFFVVMGAGYEIWDGVAVGINMRSTTKSTTIYSLRADNSINYSATATEAKSESRLSYSVVYDHGRRNPEKPFSVGAMYRAQAGVETKLSADVTAFVPVKGELISVPSYSPAEWALVGSLKAWRMWTFSFDAAWVRWSRYVSPYGTGNINTYVIGSTGNAGFKDIPVLRIGANKDFFREAKWLKKISFRAGYLYHPTPVPHQTADSNFVDNTRHDFTVGTGVGVRNPWREEDLVHFDIFAQYNWLKSRHTQKISMRNVGAPGYTSGGEILYFGGGLNIKF